MRVDSYTQIRQATQVLIHTHISYRLFVEGSAPPPFSTQNFILQLCVLRTLFALVPGTLFRDIGCRESQHELMIWRLAKKSTFSVSCREWFRNISTWRWLTGKVRWCAEEQGCHPAVRNALPLAAGSSHAGGGGRAPKEITTSGVTTQSTTAARAAPRCRRRTLPDPLTCRPRERPFVAQNQKIQINESKIKKV